ncbi:MAG: cation diffusion facilitator family transporter [Promethearchaeota archaeon]
METEEMRPPPGHGHHFEHREGDSRVYRRIARQRLLLGLFLTGSMMGVELIGGILTGSLAIISDAGHMLSHFLALLIALAAIIIATRSAPRRYTFGYYRVEILGGLFNAIFVIIVSIFILLEAIQRLINPVPVAALELLLVAILGFLVNLATMVLLQGSSQGDHNVKGAFLHVISDTFSSIGVIIAALLILFTGWVFIDPIVSFFIAIIILMWGIQLIRTTTAILLQSAPQGYDIDELEKEIKVRFPEIHHVHDVHLWELTSGIYCLSMHLNISEDCSVSATRNLIDSVNKFLCEEHGIEHTTIQVECLAVEPYYEQACFVPSTDPNGHSHQH